ncbi:Lar family restriction alleviation protein [Brucella pituitosa]|uniref:Lar family restriction alleviation protein n=1 Tax=Brucella pituitosa TaxID=571256 RepID=UPI0015E31714
MQTLKPCPFCNSTDVSVNRSEKDCMSWVSCKSCGLDAPSETGQTDEDAISYWNARPVAPVEGLEHAGWQRNHPPAGWLDCREEDVPHYRKHGQEVREVSPRSQAEAIIAAEREDYEEVLADKRRLTRLLDVAMHGEEGAAKQASLCDLIEPAKRMRADNAALTARVKELEAQLAEWEKADRLVAKALWEKKVESLEIQLAAARKALADIDNLDQADGHELKLDDAFNAVRIARAALEDRP